MEKVGIRELKTHLSRHLKKVRSGKRLLITERGRTIATISPVDAPRALDWAYRIDRKSTRLNSSHVRISYAVFSCYVALLA